MIPTTFLGRYVQLITPFWLVQWGVWLCGLHVANWFVWGALVVLIHTVAFFIAQKEQRRQREINEYD